MGKNARDREKQRRGQLNGRNWFQSSDYNNASEMRFVNDILKLVTNRFRWVGLPESVNLKWLENTLCYNGVATIAHDPAMPDVWVAAQAVTSGELNRYGEPTKWAARGVDGSEFGVTRGINGVLVYDSNQFVNSWFPNISSNWPAIMLFARQLAHIERTQDVNLLMQQTAWFLTCDANKRMDATNLFKSINGYEPAVIASPAIRDEIGIDVIKTDVPFIGEELSIAARNKYNEVYSYFGIPHLDFEKGERMIEQEAEGNNSPTNIRLLDALQPRRAALDELASIDARFEECACVFNRDVESMIFDDLLVGSIGGEGEPFE